MGQQEISLKEGNSLKSKGKSQIDWPVSFLGASGKLYVRIPRLSPDPDTKEDYYRRAAMYDSVEAYNKRAHIPTYLDLTQIDEEHISPVKIDIKTLTIIPE